MELVHNVACETQEKYSVMLEIADSEPEAVFQPRTRNFNDVGKEIQSTYKSYISYKL